ncbi:hypothetical protein pb186bvf_014322 [Paramecium bursaria]
MYDLIGTSTQGKKVSIQLYSPLNLSKKRKVQTQFLQTFKENELNTDQKPLSEFELYTLNDKLEIESDDEEQKVKKLEMDKLTLPFNNTASLDNKVLPSRSVVSKLVQDREPNKKIISVVKSKIKNLLRKKDNNDTPQVWLFQADGLNKLIWDSLCMILIFYEIIAIPMDLSFNVTLGNNFELVVDSLFMLDILISFNTTFYDKGVVIHDRKKIALNYLSSWFILDILSSFPYDLVLNDVSANELASDAQTETQTSTQTQSSTSKNLASAIELIRLFRFMRFIKIVRLLRLAKLKVIFDKFDELISSNLLLSTIISFIKLCCFVVFWSHWLGCIFHFIAQQEDPLDNWLFHFELYDESWQVRYINSLYWGVTTMNTVGYGDLSPQTPLERLVGILFLIIATVVFSNTMNSIGSSLQGLEDQRQEIRKKLNQINLYMKQQQLDSKLQTKIKKYLQFVWQQEAKYNLKAMTDDLSYNLKFELQLHVNGKILSYCKCLRTEFSSVCLKQILTTFKQYTAYPDEYIIQEDEHLDKHIYFIQNGSVNIVLIRNNQHVIQLERNEYFGEIGFFTDQKRTASAQSLHFTSLVYIDKKEFLLTLKDYQNDLQIFYKIKDEIIYNSNYSIISVYCYGCLRDDHIFINCPETHFIIQQPLYYQLKMKFQNKIASLYARKDRIHYHALVNITTIKQACNSIAPLARKWMQQYEECNLNDSVIIQTDSIMEAPDLKQVKQSKPPRFGSFRSRFREDRAKVRKMKSYIMDQEQKIRSLSFQQGINDILLKQLSTILKKQPKQDSNNLQIRGSQISQNLMGSLTRLSKKSLKMSKVLDNESEYQTLSSDSELESNITIQNYKTQNQFLEYLEEYYSSQQQREQKTMQQNFENKMFVIDIDKGIDFYSYYPQYNLEKQIKEYNQLYSIQYLKKKKDDSYIIQTELFRPLTELYFDNEFLLESMQYYQFGIKNKLMKEYEYQTLVDINKKPKVVQNNISRTKKLTIGLIRTAKTKYSIMIRSKARKQE